MNALDAFGMDYERSLALHRAVAEKLREDPRILEQARRNLETWLARGGGTVSLWRRWEEILDRPPEQVASFLVERLTMVAPAPSRRFDVFPTLSLITASLAGCAHGYLSV